MAYLYCVIRRDDKWRSASQGINFFIMLILPSSYPANRKGYNSYLSALGINPKDQASILFGAIPFEQFKSIDRRSIDDKIAEAGAECERLHDVYVSAIKDTRYADAGFAEAGWNRRSKEFINLVQSKRSNYDNTRSKKRTRHNR